MATGKNGSQIKTSARNAKAEDGLAEELAEREASSDGEKSRVSIAEDYAAELDEL